MDETTLTADTGGSVPTDSPSIDTGAATSADAAWSAVLDRATSGRSDSNPAEDVDPEPEPEPDTPVEETPEVTDGPEGAKAPVADDVDPDDYQPDSIREGPKGKQYFFRESKARGLMAARDTLDRITTAVPNATPESIQNYFDTSVRFEQMAADFDSGDPERISNFTSYWMSNEAPPHARETFAAKVMEMLPHAAPQAAQQFQRTAEQRLIQSLYEQAHQRGDDTLLKIAQNLDFRKRGAFLESGDFQQRDPYLEERQRFEQERQRFYGEQEQAAQRVMHSRMQQIDQQVKTLRASEIEAALKPAEASLKSTPQWKHMVRDLSEAVDEAIKSNTAWQQSYVLARERAANDPSGKSTEALSQMVKNFIEPIARRSSKSIINAATGTVLNASADVHSRARQQAARREPAATGAPVQRGALDAKRQEAIKSGNPEALWENIKERSRLTASRR